MIAFGRPSIAVLFAVCLGCVLGSCAEEFIPFGDDGGDTVSDDGAAQDVTEQDASDDAGTDASVDYPAGPYGVGVGDTVTDMSFTRHDGSTLRLADYFADPSARLVLISTSAEWCTACREEQPLLQSLFEQYGEDGFRVMVTLFEDSDFNPAEISNVLNWRAQYRLSFDTVLDAGNSFSEFYDTSLTPMNMFVDTRTMQIVSLQTGAISEGESRPLIELFVN